MSGEASVYVARIEEISQASSWLLLLILLLFIATVCLCKWEVHLTQRCDILLRLPEFGTEV